LNKFRKLKENLEKKLKTAGAKSRGHGGHVYYFCSQHYRKKFEAVRASYVNPTDATSHEREKHHGCRLALWQGGCDAAKKADESNEAGAIEQPLAGRLPRSARLAGAPSRRSYRNRGKTERAMLGNRVSSPLMAASDPDRKA
jgi:YHS domain-containing protein